MSVILNYRIVKIRYSGLELRFCSCKVEVFQNVELSVQIKFIINDCNYPNSCSIEFTGITEHRIRCS